MESAVLGYHSLPEDRRNVAKSLGERWKLQSARGNVASVSLSLRDRSRADNQELCRRVK